MRYTIAAFYRFTPLAEPAVLRDALLALCVPLGLLGTLLLAPEGINGTLAGSAAAIDALLAELARRTGLARDEVKFSAAFARPFERLKLRLKKEIITFNQPSADPALRTGQPVAPKDWHALLDDPGVTLLDTRNRYETLIGSFPGAELPPIERFTAFAEYVRTNLDPKRQPKIAMFCTGGVRCEKAAAFMLAEGFAEVYHLKGGILKYLEDIPADESRWQGECYVFDRRMAVGQGLATGSFTMCFTCGYPLTAEDRQHPQYEEGVACGYCHADTTDDDKARYRTRQRQMDSNAANTARTLPVRSVNSA